MTRVPTVQVIVSEGTHDPGHPVLTIGGGAIDRIERTIKVNQDDGLQVWLKIRGIEYGLDEGLSIIQNQFVEDNP